MDDYFSNYIKELDPVHKQLLEKIETVRTKLEQVNQELLNIGDRSEREAIAKQLYGLRSKEKRSEQEEQTIKILEERLKGLPDRERLIEEKQKLEQELKELEDKFVNTPFEVKPCEITPIIIYKTETGAYIKQSLDSNGIPKGEFYYYPEIEGRTAEPNFKIEVDENGIPAKQSWIIQKSFFSHGLPIKFERKLVLKQPIIEQLKPKIMEKEIVVEKPVYKPIEKILPSFNCSRCNWNLIDKLRMVYCPNCGLDLYTSLKENINKENQFNEQKNNNKKKKKWF